MIIAILYQFTAQKSTIKKPFLGSMFLIYMNSKVKIQKIILSVKHFGKKYDNRLHFSKSLNNHVGVILHIKQIGEHIWTHFCIFRNDNPIKVI